MSGFIAFNSVAQIWSAAGIFAGINDFNPSQFNKKKLFGFGLKKHSAQLIETPSS
jgi:hypothetical protein